MNYHKNTKSFQEFEQAFKHLNVKLNRNEETIFENTLPDVSEETIMENYNYFYKHHIGDFHKAEKHADRKVILEASLLESYYNPIFKMISEKDDGSSYSAGFLLENTAEELIKIYNNNPLNHAIITEGEIPNRDLPNQEILTEGGINWGLMTGGGAVAAGAGALPAVAIGGLTALAIELFLPSRWTRTIDGTIEKWFGTIVKTIVQTNSSFLISQDMKNSNNIILNFDNIHTSPEVRKLFQKIGKTTDIKEVTEGLEQFVSSCAGKHANAFDIGKNDEIKQIIQGKFDKRDYNPLRLIYNAVLNKSGSDRNYKDELIKFRKCLASKFIDVYKLLLIKNLQEKQDYETILDNINKSRTKPEMVLTFNSEDMDNKEYTNFKEAIKSLIQFRDYLITMSQTMKTGIFDVDKESGLFLEQKLKVVDTEVRQYIKNHRSKSSTREYKYIPGQKQIRKSRVLGNL